MQGTSFNWSKYITWHKLETNTWNSVGSISNVADDMYCQPNSGLLWDFVNDEVEIEAASATIFSHSECKCTL